MIRYATGVAGDNKMFQMIVRSKINTVSLADMNLYCVQIFKYGQTGGKMLNIDRMAGKGDQPQKL